MEHSSKGFYPHGIKGAYSEGEKQGYMLGKKEGSKETAEKIFNELWYAIKNHCGYEESLDKDDLKHYAKQFSIEIKE